MKFSWVLILAIGLFSVEIPARGATPALKKISRPLFLKSADKVPGILGNPEVPKKGSDGSPLGVTEAIDAPPVDMMKKLSDPEIFEVIKKTKKTEETRINQIYWHASGDWKYCHFRDAEGNHWYGWNDGQSFHWVLWRGNRFWWRDSFAGHWLYYFRNYWWRSELQTSNSLQVLIDGEYYLCQKDGTISTDLGRDGNGLINSGTGRFRGDFHHGGHGHEGGHEGSGAKSPSNGGGNPGGATGPGNPASN